MTLPREAWQEDSLEPVSQYLHPGSDPQTVTVSITENPASVQVIEYISDTPSPSTGEGAHHLGQSHQVRHSNSVKNPNYVNLDAETLDSTSG